MTKSLKILTIALLLTSCRTSAKTVTVESSSHADSVATLASRSATTIDRVETWETIVLKPDTLGRLVPVAHNIVRHSQKSTQNVTKTDTTTFTASVEESHHEEEKKVAEVTQTRGKGLTGFLIGIGVMVAALTVLLVVYLIQKTKLKKWI